jgi:hypothetical protein
MSASLASTQIESAVEQFEIAKASLRKDRHGYKQSLLFLLVFIAGSFFGGFFSKFL